jgi:hypothetical protein
MSETMTIIDLEPGFFAQVHHFNTPLEADLVGPPQAIIRRVQVKRVNVGYYEVHLICERDNHPMKEADIAPLERARTLLRMWSTGYDCPHLEPYLEHCLVCETKRFIGAI